MEENVRITTVTPQKHVLFCSQCKDAEMDLIGNTENNGIYSCPVCQNEEFHKELYPSIRHIEIEEVRKQKKYLTKKQFFLYYFGISGIILILANLL